MFAIGFDVKTYCFHTFPSTNRGKPRGILVENYIVFGRVATGRTVRAKGYGKKLIGELLAYCDINFPRISIQCSARAYLKQFYENFGFKVHGEIYEEDGFPHLAMQIDK